MFTEEGFCQAEFWSTLRMGSEASAGGGEELNSSNSVCGGELIFNSHLLPSRSSLDAGRKR